MKMRKTFPVINILSKSLVDLPAPSNITNMWNFGSVLGMFLTTQIISGIFLAMYYASYSEYSFMSVSMIMRSVEGGSFMRLFHANGASMFFLIMYFHIARNIYYQCFLSKKVWVSGTLILILSMATAFLGYVLPWGQMSYWGATVITNMVSAIPYVGSGLVVWLWGGFSVNPSTLSRFYSLHYTLPFILLLMVMVHLLFLHISKSTNPLGLDSKFEKIMFSPYFVYKDTNAMLIFFFMFMLVIFEYPFSLMDPDNFSFSNPLNTPNHIQPEWYFLFAYTILRAIPNKLGGVLALLSSILFLVPMSMQSDKTYYSKTKMSNFLFWSFTANFTILTVLGMKPVETPYILSSSISTVFYFMFLMF